MPNISDFVLDRLIPDVKIDNVWWNSRANPRRHLLNLVPPRVNFSKRVNPHATILRGLQDAIKTSENNLERGYTLITLLLDVMLVRMGTNYYIIARLTRGCSSAVERSLCMREAPGSKPGISIAFYLILAHILS